MAMQKALIKPRTRGGISDDRWDDLVASAGLDDRGRLERIAYSQKTKDCYPVAAGGFEIGSQSQR